MTNPASTAYPTQLQQLGLSADAALSDVNQVVISAQASLPATNSVLITAGVLTLALVPVIWLARGPFSAPAEASR